MSQKVVITGMGMVSSLGWSVRENWSAVIEKRTGIGKLLLFESPRCGNLPVAQIKHYPSDMAEKISGDTPRSTVFGCYAADEALLNAGLKAGTSILKDASIVIGCCTGGMLETENFMERHYSKSLSEIGKEISVLGRHPCAYISDVLAGQYGIKGLRYTVSSACASGSEAIAIACDLIESGQAQVVLAGGTDCLTRLTLNGFASLLVVDPYGTRPFDVDRSGMNLGEGAGMLVLESKQHAEERGADVYAWISGWAGTCDAYHVTAPDSEGQGALLCMKKALKKAKLQPTDIDYINAHGSGTVNNDIAEGKAVKKLFTSSIDISSTKGCFGHTLAATGAMEAVISVMAIEHQMLPPNRGFNKCDPEIGLEPVTIPARKKIDAVLSNSLGFGGNNCSLVITKEEIEKGL